MRNVEVKTIESAISGNQEAFAEIYRTYSSMVLSVCMNFLRNQDEAEDLSQETFIQIYKKLHQFRNKSQFSTWVYSVTRNQCLMFLRQKKRMVNAVELYDTDAVFELYTVENPDNRILLSEAVNQLPQGYRNSFILKNIFGYEHSEIAKILNVHEGTSKSQHSKAKSRLQKNINRRKNPKLHF